MYPERQSGVPHIAALAICSVLAMAGVFRIVTVGGLIGWLMAGFLVPGLHFLFAPRAGELRLVAKLVAALAGFTAALVAGVFLVLESGEVVVLKYEDDSGNEVSDRLWVIDMDGRPSVTTGADTARVALVQAEPSVELLRGGEVECRRAIVIPAHEATAEERLSAERLFKEKYGNRLYATRTLQRFLGGAGAEPVLIRLDPCG